MSFSRRALLKATAASAVMGGISAPMVARAQAAEFSYKYANNLPDSHPMNARAKEMAAAIKAETNGRFDLQVFPNNQLGSDTDMLSQIRSGGVEFFTLSGPDPVDPGAGRLDQRHRLRVPGLRHGVEGHGRRSRRLCARRDQEGRPRGHGQDLGQRLPPDHVIDQADNGSGRFQGLQDPRAGLAAVDLDVQGLRCGARLNQFQRGLFRAADQGRRGPGKSAGASSRPPSSTRCRSTAR